MTKSAIEKNKSQSRILEADIRKEPRKASSDRFVPRIGLLLLFMEVWKQFYLYYMVFHKSYQVWYFPFQLCSMPIYLCLLYGFLSYREKQARRIDASAAAAVTAAHASDFEDTASAPSLSSKLLPVLALFLRDYGVLGGIAALIVHAGFTWPDHPLLTMHGYLWHIILILLGALLTRHGLCPKGLRSFWRTVPLFLLLSAMAEGINVLLHPYGDCDMFYISPYHLSSQPVFHQIDAVIGRIPGIAVYLTCVVLGAFLVHGCFCIWEKRKASISA